MIAIRALTLLTLLCIPCLACVTTYFILYFFVYRVKILKQDWRPVLAKAAISLIVWLALSFGMLFIIFFGLIYGDRFDDTPPTLREEAYPMIFLLVCAIVYGLLGWGLCYWVRGAPTKEVKEQDMKL
jgi:hypothetical protein